MSQLAARTLWSGSGHAWLHLGHAWLHSDTHGHSETCYMTSSTLVLVLHITLILSSHFIRPRTDITSTAGLGNDIFAKVLSASFL